MLKASVCKGCGERCNQNFCEPRCMQALIEREEWQRRNYCFGDKIPFAKKQDAVNYRYRTYGREHNTHVRPCVDCDFYHIYSDVEMEVMKSSHSGGVKEMLFIPAGLWRSFCTCGYTSKPVRNPADAAYKMRRHLNAKMNYPA